MSIKNTLSGFIKYLKVASLLSTVHSWYVDSYLISEISLVNNKIRVLVHKGKPDFMMNPVTTVDD